MAFNYSYNPRVPVNSDNDDSDSDAVMSRVKNTKVAIELIDDASTSGLPSPIVEMPELENPFFNPEVLVEPIKPILSNYLSSFNFDNFSVISIITQLVTIISLVIPVIRKSISFKQIRFTLISSLITLCISILYATKKKIENNSYDTFKEIITASFKDDDRKFSEETIDHLKIIDNFPDRISVRKYINKENLHNQIRLPSCTWNDIQNCNDSTFFWIFRFYSPKFLSMWFGVPLWKIQTFILNKEVNNINLVKQFLPSELNALKQFLSRLFGIIISYVLSKLYGNNFSKKDIIDGYHIGKDLSTFTGDYINDLFNLSSSNEKDILYQVEDFTSEFNKFLEIPTFEFARNQTQIYRVAKIIDDCNSFIRQCPKEFSNLLFPLQGLIVAVVKRKNEILTSTLPKFKRQEPFVIFLQGKGAIGKTKFIQEYLVPNCLNLIDNPSNDFDYIEVRHDDKYWPPLSGQRIAFFDEVGTVNDIKDDLLLSNLKGLCSPTYFNCPAADIEHKVTPCPFQLIFAATNRTFYDIQGKIASAFSPESVYPTWRRCITIECEWNELKFGKFNFTNPSGHVPTWDHLKLYLCNWDEQTKKLIRRNEISKEQLVDLIKIRYQKMESEHIRTVNMNNLVKQNNSKLHYSVHLYGSPGAGKTPAINEYALHLSKLLSYPIKNFKSFNELNFEPDREYIYILDDLFNNNTTIADQQLFMNFYNHIAVNSSIFLFGSNIKFNYSLPKILFDKILFTRKHPLQLSGMTKRLGFLGTFENDIMPSYNTEFYFKNDKAYLFNEYYIKFITFIPFILSIVLSLISPMFLLVNLYYFTYKSKLNSIDQPLEYIYNSYVNFLQMQNNIPVVNGNLDKTTNFDYILECDNLNSVNFSSNRFILYKHIFVDINKFNSFSSNWKSYISQELLNLFSNNYEQFIIDCNSFTEKDIIKELIRIRKIFLSAKHHFNIKISISNIGEFYLYDNKIVKHIYPSISNNNIDLFVTHDNTDLIVYSLSGTIRIPLSKVLDQNFSPSNYNLKVFVHLLILIGLLLISNIK